MTPEQLITTIYQDNKNSPTVEISSISDINPTYGQLLEIAKRNQANQQTNPTKNKLATLEQAAEEERDRELREHQQAIETSQTEAHNQAEALKQLLGSQDKIDSAQLEIVQDPETSLYHLAVRGDIYLKNLTSAEGLQLPTEIGGDLYLNGLTSAEGLQLPAEIGGGLGLNGLTSAEGLQLPPEIGGSLDLRGLTSAEGLQLPTKIGGYLGLNGLTSAEGLQLPTEIGGGLYLNGLTSAEGLQLPTEIGVGIYLYSLPEDQKQQLREQRPDLDI